MPCGILLSRQREDEAATGSAVAVLRAAAARGAKKHAADINEVARRPIAVGELKRVQQAFSALRKNNGTRNAFPIRAKGFSR